ncbi:FixH family protein [Chitinivorax sp. PXF-14]|uniref:FixH family protein n=1 Tax=Chitinivorax sp. PXF-14 TaxID=3230488 RepID=UPI00346581B7
MSSPLPQADGKKRWYRHLGPWLLMAGPATVVAASLFTAWLAYTRQDDMVESDYYQAGESVNQTLKTNRYALQQHLAGQLQFTGQGAVSLDLVPCPDGHCPPSVTLALRHPAKHQFDQTIPLALDGDHHYVGHASLPPARRWYLTLGDNEHRWRIGAVWDTAKAGVTTSGATAPGIVTLHPLQSVSPEDD